MNLKFETLILKIGCLLETNRAINHKSIPVYNLSRQIAFMMSVFCGIFRLLPLEAKRKPRLLNWPSHNAKCSHLLKWLYMMPPYSWRNKHKSSFEAWCSIHIPALPATTAIKSKLYLNFDVAYKQQSSKCGQDTEKCCPLRSTNKNLNSRQGN